MQPRAEDRNRPAIAVERGVGDKLVIQRGVNGFPDFEIVVGLQDFLPPVIQIAISCQDTSAARRKEILVNLRNTIEHTGKPKGVIGPPPRFAFDADAAVAV